MKIFNILFILFVALGLVAWRCNNNTQTSDQKLSQGQEQLMQQAVDQVGMPAVKNFQERKLMKVIIEERDKVNLICYAYLFSEMTGKLIYIGKCVGYGLPYATQYTSPKKVIKFDGNTWYAGQDPQTIEQADPNGLYMPQSAEGTWVNLIDPSTGKPQVVYIEPRCIVSPFPLTAVPQ